MCSEFGNKLALKLSNQPELPGPTHIDLLLWTRRNVSYGSRVYAVILAG
jgi:hypothetical protein